MIRHQEVYFSTFSVEQLYNLVKGVESYPDFLPWCSKARIIELNEKYIIAELVIHFAALYEKYTSKVYLHPPVDKKNSASIDVELVDGPFNKLDNYWKFEHDADQGKTKVTFEICFEFKSAFLQKMIGAMFQSAVKKMMSSFEERAKSIYL